MKVYKNLSKAFSDIGIRPIKEPDLDPASHEIFVRFLYSKFPELVVPYIETGSLVASFNWLMTLKQKGLLIETYDIPESLREVQNAIKLLMLSSKGKKYQQSIADVFNDLIEYSKEGPRMSEVSKERLQYYIEYQRRCLETLRQCTESVLSNGTTAQMVKLLTTLDSALDSQFNLLGGLLKSVETDYVRNLVL